LPQVPQLLVVSLLVQTPLQQISAPPLHVVGGVSGTGTKSHSSLSSSQTPVLHSFPGQTRGVPAQTPVALQTSSTVQNNPSSQVAPGVGSRAHALSLQTATWQSSVGWGHSSGRQTKKQAPVT
jgi:hypothetical protein